MWPPCAAGSLSRGLEEYTLVVSCILDETLAKLCKLSLKLISSWRPESIPPPKAALFDERDRCRS